MYGAKIKKALINIILPNLFITLTCSQQACHINTGSNAYLWQILLNLFDNL